MAALAGASELAGGALIALGVGGPVGPAAVAGTMVVAARTAHAGKPYFAQEGGPELPVADFAIAAALAAFGFGRYSLDRALHARYPNAIRGLAFGVAIANAGAVVARARHERSRAAAEASSQGEAPVTAGELATERARRQPA
jgi:putative oxidoreductase